MSTLRGKAPCIAVAICGRTGMKLFERLLKVVRERGGVGPRIGRRWCLPLADRVLVVAVHYRTPLTMRQLAPLVGVTRPRCAG